MTATTSTTVASSRHDPPHALVLSPLAASLTTEMELDSIMLEAAPALSARRVGTMLISSAGATHCHRVQRPLPPSPARPPGPTRVALTLHSPTRVALTHACNTTSARALLHMMAWALHPSASATPSSTPHTPHTRHRLPHSQPTPAPTPVPQLTHVFVPARSHRKYKYPHGWHPQTAVPVRCPRCARTAPTASTAAFAPRCRPHRPRFHIPLPWSA